MVEKDLKLDQIQRSVEVVSLNVTKIYMELSKRIESIDTRLKMIETTIEDIQAHNGKKITVRARELVSLFEAAELKGLDGLSIGDISQERNISYPAALRLIQRLKDNNYLDEIRPAKGRKTKYKLRKK